MHNPLQQILSDQQQIVHMYNHAYQRRKYNDNLIANIDTFYFFV